MTPEAWRLEAILGVWVTGSIGLALAYVGLRWSIDHVRYALSFWRYRRSLRALNPTLYPRTIIRTHGRI